VPSRPPPTFTPKPLRGVDAHRHFTSLAGPYFLVANELRENSRRGATLSGSYYIFPAVAFYMAAFEAFLQENLTFARWHLEDSGDPTTTAILGTIDELKAQRGPYQDFKCWVKEIFRRFDRRGLGIKTNSQEFQNLLALKELRNAIIHYNPVLIEHIHWPARLEQALRRTKLEVVNGGWVANFQSPVVAD
jgi:hypothetical protein